MNQPGDFQRKQIHPRTLGCWLRNSGKCSVCHYCCARSARLANDSFAAAIRVVIATDPAVADLPVEPSSAGRYPVDMESCVADIEQIDRTLADTLERMQREQRVSVGRLVGIMPAGNFTMMPRAFGALFRVIALGFHRL